MGDWPDDPTTPSPTEVNVTDGPDADPHPERGEGAREPDAWMTEARFPDHGWCGLHLFCNRQRAEESAEFGRRDDQPPFDTTEIRVVPLYRDALTDCEPGEEEGWQELARQARESWTDENPYETGNAGDPAPQPGEGEERYVVCGVGGFGAFDDYDEARQFAEDEARRMGSDPILQRGEVPLFTVTDTETIPAGASEDHEPQRGGDG